MADCRNAWTDLLYRGVRILASAGGSSISGASNEVVSMVVPMIVSFVPRIELNGRLSQPTPRLESSGRDSS